MGFAGMERDTVTGMNLAVYRVQNPGTGRWTSQDPLGFGGGDANLYRYVENSATNFADELGLQDVTLPNPRPNPLQGNPPNGGMNPNPRKPGNTGPGAAQARRTPYSTAPCEAHVPVVGELPLQGRQESMGNAGSEVAAATEGDANERVGPH